jgi:2-dehydropantoate 2-reductase
MARHGEDVVLFARGPHFRAMQERGVRVISSGEEFVAHPEVVEDLEKAGAADVIFLGVKAHSLTDLAPRLRVVTGQNTVFVSTQNGIPWWYFQNTGDRFEGLQLQRVDPGGVISRAIDSQRVLASIVYFSTEITEPGVIRHTEGNRISLGEPDGSRSDRSRQIARALIAAGFRAPITTRIRSELWVKMMGNVAFNPISALTRATLVEMVRDADVSRLARNMMLEVEAVARTIGIEMPVSIDQRIAGAEKVGEHKTSMLQDLENGRPMELDAIVGAVVELGDRLDIPMPHCSAVYACTKLLSAIPRKIRP